MSVAIDAAQQPEAIDNQAVGLGDILLGGLRIAQAGASQLTFDLTQMVLSDDMRSQDELHTRVGIEVGNDDVLVGCPAAPGHQDEGHSGGKALHQRKGACLTADVEHTVETRVAHHRDVVADAASGQQAGRLLVLHEEVGHELQHLGIVPAIPAEEYLVLAEDAAHAVEGDVMVLAAQDIVHPELILDEEGHLGLHMTEGAYDVARRIERQVADDVGSGIVLPHLVARGGEECEQNLILGMLAAETFHEGPSLLKLAERGGVEPDISGSGLHLLAQYSERIPMTLDDEPRLAMEWRDQEHGHLV